MIYKLLIEEPNMTHLLAVNSSPNLSSSVSRDLVMQFATSFEKQASTNTVTVRDVGKNPLPHLDETTTSAFYTPSDQLSEEQKQAISLSDTLVEEVMQADVIVVGAPMHNFGSSSHLKAYLDHIARVGRTITYTEEGPKGLLGGRKVFVVTARGGVYSKGPASHMDIQVPYLKTFFSFVGIENVTFIHAEGLNMGDDSREKAIDAAVHSISASVNGLAA